MATTTETLLLQVDIPVNLERIAQLKLILADNKKELDSLNKAFKENRISQEQLAIGQTLLEQKSKQAQQEISVLNRAIDAQNTITKEATGSVNQLAAQSKLLATQVNALSAEQKKTEGGQALVAQLKKVNDELIAQGKNVSDGRRNLGNYETALKNASVGAKDLTGGLKTASDTALKPFQGLLDKGTGLFTKYKSGTDLVNKGLTSLQGAGETGSLGFKAIAVGIGLTGIGAFIIAISLVVSYFTQTNEGSKLLKQGLAGLGAVVTTVANTFTGAGKSLVSFFSEPQKIGQKFMAFLKDQFINRVAAFGLLLDGIRNRDFKKITDSLFQFETGVTNVNDKINAYAANIGKAGVAALKLEAAQQALKRSRAKLEQDEILEKGRVEELMRLSKDRELSAADRLSKLREAGKLEGELSERSLKQISAELKAIKERNEAKGLSVTTDEIQEERDKQKEYNATVVERNNTLATIKARQSRFILEEAAELKKAQADRATVAQKAKEDAIKNLITEQEQRLLIAQKGSLEELAIRERIIQLQANLEKEGAKKSAADKALIQAQANDKIKQLDEEFIKNQVEIAQNRSKEANEQLLKGYEDAQKQLEDSLLGKKQTLDKDRASDIISETLYQQQLYELNKAELALELANAEAYGQDKAKIEKKIADNEIANNKRVSQEKKKIEDTKIGIAQTGAEAGIAASDAVINALGKESEAGKIAVEAKKAFTILEIGINLQKQLSLNAVAADELKVIPIVGPALGTAYEITEDALAIAQAAAQVTAVAAFNRGGIVPGYGPNVDDTTTPVYLTKGEAVMTRAAVETYGGLLGHVNALSGGVNFAPNQEFPPVMSYLSSLAGGLSFAPSFTPGQQGAASDGGLMARALGNSVMPTAAEIGREVGKNVPKHLSFQDTGRQIRQFHNARSRTTTPGDYKDFGKFPYSSNSGA